MNGQLPGPKCAGLNVIIFYPTVKGQDGPALALCDECSLREPCLEHALEHEDHGIWGGTTERDRRRIRRGRGKPAVIHQIRKRKAS